MSPPVRKSSAAAACAQAKPVRDGAANVLDFEELEPLLERLDHHCRPAAAWLFRSRARGDAAPSSDWDHLGVVPDEIADAQIDPWAVWCATRGIGSVADVLLRRKSDFEEARNTCNTLAYEATRTGAPDPSEEKAAT